MFNVGTVRGQRPEREQMRAALGLLVGLPSSLWRVWIPLSTEEAFPLSSWAHLVFATKGSEVSGLNALTDQLEWRKDRKQVRPTP